MILEYGPSQQDIRHMCAMRPISPPTYIDISRVALLSSSQPKNKQIFAQSLRSSALLTRMMLSERRLWEECARVESTFGAQSSCSHEVTIEVFVGPRKCDHDFIFDRSCRMLTGFHFQTENGLIGVIFVRTVRTIIVAEYAPPIQAGEATPIAENVADYLISTGN